jgi:hypothetical protein
MSYTEDDIPVAAYVGYQESFAVKTSSSIRTDAGRSF